MSFEAFKSIKFQRATLEAIDRVNAILAEYQMLGFALTLRQLFYQCVSRKAIANTFDEYRKLGRTVVDGRRAGLIDWDAIEDRTRHVRYLPTWSGRRRSSPHASAYISRTSGPDSRTGPRSGLRKTP